jgi:hypothetical protein
VNLTSTPGLPREDVLSLITTGHTQQELREAGITRQSMGMGVLAGELTSAIGQPISRKTGLDVFRLEASESGQLSKLSVGKYVSDRLDGSSFQSDFAPRDPPTHAPGQLLFDRHTSCSKARVIWEKHPERDRPPGSTFNLSFRCGCFRFRQ